MKLTNIAKSQLELGFYPHEVGISYKQGAKFCLSDVLSWLPFSVHYPCELCGRHCKEVGFVLLASNTGVWCQACLKCLFQPDWRIAEALLHTTRHHVRGPFNRSFPDYLTKT